MVRPRTLHPRGRGKLSTEICTGRLRIKPEARVNRGALKNVKKILRPHRATTNDTFGSREKWPLQNGWVGGIQKVRSLAAPQRGGNKWGCAATAQHVWGSAGASGRGARPVSNQPKSGQPPGAIPARGVLSRGCAACGAGAGAAPAQRRPSGGSSSFQAGEVSSAAVQISQKTISKIQLNSYERRKTYLTYFCPRARGFESRSSDFLFAIFVSVIGNGCELEACVFVIFQATAAIINSIN